MSNNYFNKVKEIIEDKLGIEPEEVTPEAFFEDDLNVSEMELIEILQELEESFHIELLDKRENIESIADLLDILSEKLD